MLGLQRDAGNAAVQSYLTDREPSTPDPYANDPAYLVGSPVGDPYANDPAYLVGSPVGDPYAIDPTYETAFEDDYIDTLDLELDLEDEPSVGAQSALGGNQAPATKYGQVRSLGSGYEGESESNRLDFVLEIFNHALAGYLRAEGILSGSQREVHAMLKAGRLPAEAAEVANDPAVARKMLIEQMGWRAEDIPMVMQARTTYLATDDDRHAYELTGGGTLMQNGAPFDTTAPEPMYSKFSGKGWGIYVMAPDGRLYAGSHRVGLFHHSSFLAGGDVAGAGELKAESGRLRGITNKSGHYTPGPEHMRQVLEELAARGSSLAGVQLRLVGAADPGPFDAATWLREQTAPQDSSNDGPVLYSEVPSENGQYIEDDEGVASGGSDSYSLTPAYEGSGGGSSGGGSDGYSSTPAHVGLAGGSSGDEQVGYVYSTTLDEDREQPARSGGRGSPASLAYLRTPSEVP
ncbi:MAG: hypothetical protein ACLFV0_00590 [Nitriliruptoraceae bacterium]